MNGGNGAHVLSHAMKGSHREQELFLRHRPMEEEIVQVKVQKQKHVIILHVLSTVNGDLMEIGRPAPELVEREKSRVQDQRLYQHQMEGKNV